MPEANRGFDNHEGRAPCAIILGGQLRQVNVEFNGGCLRVTSCPSRIKPLNCRKGESSRRGQSLNEYNEPLFRLRDH